MKLNLEALKERAGAVASEELLATINGGLLNACHDTPVKLPNDITLGDGTIVRSPRDF